MTDNESALITEDPLIVVIPSFTELENINERQEEKKRKDINSETARLLTQKGIATILRENADKIIAGGEEVNIEIISDNMPENIKISDIQLATEFIFKQKGYDVTTKTMAGNFFSLSIKRITE